MPICVENLSHEYLRGTPFAREALRSVTLRVEDGEFLGVIGRTGSGKSTLIQHFNGLLRPESGTVTVDGAPTTGKGLKELRRKVGLVFQFPEYQLFEETVFKDIAYGAAKLGLAEAEVRRRVLAAAEAVGLPEAALGKSPFELSGGQKRRCAIAGVLVMEPRYLVMDEPASGLDPEGKEEILGYAERLHRERGVAVVLVSHNMEDVARYASRVVAMDDGRVVMDGPPEDVFLRVEELERIGLRPPDIQYFAREAASVFPGFSRKVLTAAQAAGEIEKWLRAAGVMPRPGAAGAAGSPEAKGAEAASAAAPHAAAAEAAASAAPAASAAEATEAAAPAPHAAAAEAAAPARPAASAAEAAASAAAALEGGGAP